MDRGADLDVIIVGAGLSGVGAACQLTRRCPGLSYALLESRHALGGTWDLFRYPGIRSDSDMFTLGYAFRPWDRPQAIADGPSIRDYIAQTAREYRVEPRIRYGHRVTQASWSSESALWTLHVEREGQKPKELTCRFLHWCSGYYRYDGGYAPEFPGQERFQGTIVHPQQWPEDLDYAGRRIVVIGSGATAVTLVPSLAACASHVTMLQRSPSYVVSLPAADDTPQRLQRWLPAHRVYSLIRWRNVARMQLSYAFSRRQPETMKRMLLRWVTQQLPPGFDVERHFQPVYNPWDQRLCLVPDGDLFSAIREGRASVVTDTIETFTEHGVKLSSGPELDADVIVTATGLNVELLGGARLIVDGREIDPAACVFYKGSMLSGVPNAAVALGYTNASWTLKCDLTSEYVCRVLGHMARHGHSHCLPLTPPAGDQLEPIINLDSGYIHRARGRLPQQGSRPPWRLHQNYFLDLRLIRRAPLEDEGIRFLAASGSATPLGSGTDGPESLGAVSAVLEERSVHAG